ncbi:hypothetical protein CTA2_7000 [Colletotrichum tanaceti]|uniref:Tse2 ADP-ribosyltransferase toxin domain-containing protein n=1 Tax=Colletotrichum tanaceti TaxID=1306861 RepID=A0A4U6X1X2_9PEZI|nr:hypothetical protein CTA2_7000 [Colletotrichum tanaceti]TKW48749.1 hypothetical protein CTA1_12522 [Colletotrichum tanaceti]
MNSNRFTAIACFRKAVLLSQQQKTRAHRRFSAKAIYSSFPATLHYYSPRRTSTLFDHSENDTRPYDLFDEGVNVDKSGLVYPAVTTNSVSNGAVMFPNTFWMQELVRRYYDEVLDQQDEGVEVETPCIFTIFKGTILPSNLVLINEHTSRFTLQPSLGMSINDLNRCLTEFYVKNASQESVETWLDTHPFKDAAADDADAVWMAK